MSSPTEFLVKTGFESNYSLDPEAPSEVARKPKRVLHFSDGTLEEYSDEEGFHDPSDDVDHGQKAINSKKSTATVPTKSPENMRWGEYLLHVTMTFGVRSLNACDYFGEKFAWLLGITTPKYGYAIEERDWQKREEQREKERENQARAKRNAVKPEESANNNSDGMAEGGHHLNGDTDILSTEKDKY